jgi:hypothetical protein
LSDGEGEEKINFQTQFRKTVIDLVAVTIMEISRRRLIVNCTHDKMLILYKYNYFRNWSY